MTAYILRRLVMLVPVLIVVGIVVFALVHLTPGDPAAVMLGDSATPEQIARLRDQLGLERPAAGAVRALVQQGAAARLRRVDLSRRAGHSGICWTACSRQCC